MVRRFKCAYNIGKDLNHMEVKEKLTNLKDHEIHIIDTTGELPNLTITDMDKGKQYCRYMNRPVDEQKIDHLIKDIHNELESLNTINRDLVKPDRIVIDSDYEGNSIMGMSLKDELFYIGYNTKISNKTKNINNKLKQLKKILLKE
jgi:hypothetical protein